MMPLIKAEIKAKHNIFKAKGNIFKSNYNILQGKRNILEADLYYCYDKLIR